MAQTLRPITADALFDPGLPEVQERPDRLETLQRSAGFLAVTREELTKALGLLNYEGRVGGAGWLIGEVIKHQAKAQTEDPQAATRAIVRAFMGYADDAASRHQALSEFSAEIYDANPKLWLEQVVAEPQNNFALASLIRYRDLIKLRNRIPVETIGCDPQTFDYSVSNEQFQQHLALQLTGSTVRQAKIEVPLASNDQAHRAEYWNNRLEEIYRTTKWVRPVIDDRQSAQQVG